MHQRHISLYAFGYTRFPQIRLLIQIKHHHLRYDGCKGILHQCQLVKSLTSFTMIFVVLLSGHFLSLQIIYGGKTVWPANLYSKLKLPAGLYSPGILNCWSSEKESFKLIDKVINPQVYVI